MIWRLKKCMDSDRLLGSISQLNKIITSFEFKENIIDQYIYLKVSRNKFMILVLYIDDIMLVSNDLSLLKKIK